MVNNSINEDFLYSSLTDEEQNKIYDIFKASYEKSTGSAWSLQKFENRAYNWLFFGDDTGFIAVRPQKSGPYKLTGVAGNLKGILKGLDELMATNKPIWGMVTSDIKDMALKKGFKSPSPMLAKMIVKMIPSNVFGNTDFDINDDGSITLKYSDVGDSRKYFIGNNAYYDYAMGLLKTQFKDKVNSMVNFPLFGNNQKSLK